MRSRRGEPMTSHDAAGGAGRSGGRLIAGASVRQSVLIVGAWIIALATAIPFIAVSAAPDRAIVHVSAYTLSFLAAGTIAWIRRPANYVGPLMLAVAVFGSLTFLGRIPNPTIGHLAGLAGSLSNLLIAWVTLSAPSGRLERGPSRGLLAAFGIVLLVVSLVESLDLLRVMFAVGVVVSLAIALVVLRRGTTATAASRRSLTPVVIAG